MHQVNATQRYPSARACPLLVAGDDMPGWQRRRRRLDAHRRRPRALARRQDGPRFSLSS